MRKKTAILLFTIVFLFMCMILTGVLSGIKGWVYANHVNDKIAHISFAAVLTLLANFIFYPRKVRIFSWKVLLGTAIMFTLFSIDEFLQWPLPGRDADLLDLAASYSGMLIGVGLFHLWKKQPHEKQAKNAHNASGASV